MTVEVKINGGYTAIVDDVDGDLAVYKWQSLHAARFDFQAAYAYRNSGRQGKRRRYDLHRVILERTLGRKLEKGEIADHKDCNPLNNTRTNIRLANGSQSRANTRRNRVSKSGFKGVSRSHSKWKAVIKVYGQELYLGVYATPEEAHKAYCDAAIEHFGEFARFE